MHAGRTVLGKHIQSHIAPGELNTWNTMKQVATLQADMLTLFSTRSTLHHVATIPDFQFFTIQC